MLAYRNLLLILETCSCWQLPHLTLLQFRGSWENESTAGKHSLCLTYLNLLCWHKYQMAPINGNVLS